MEKEHGEESEIEKGKVSEWKRFSPKLLAAIVKDAIMHPLSDTTFDVETGKVIERVPSKSPVAEALRRPLFSRKRDQTPNDKNK